MSLNQLFRGTNRTRTPDRYDVYSDVSFDISEGWFDGSSNFYGVYVSSARLEDFDHRMGVYNDTISFALSSQAKKLRDWTTTQTLSYSSARVLYDGFENSNKYSDRWQATGTNWSQSNGMLVGASVEPPEAIVNTVLGNVYNLVFETKVRNNTDAANVFASMGARITNNSVYNSDSISVTLDYNANEVYVQQRGISAVTNYLNTPQTLGTSTFYWIRGVLVQDRLYGFFSPDGKQWAMLGGTYMGITNVNRPGSMFLTQRAGTAEYDYVKAFESGPIWDVNSLVRDIAKRSGIEEVYIPDLYGSTFQSLTGLTTNTSGWSANSSLSTLYGIGRSISTNNWSLITTGRSLFDFRMDVDLRMGPSSYAGLMVGTGFTNFAGIYFYGHTDTTGLSQIMVQNIHGGIEVTTNGLSRAFFDHNAPLFAYPYAQEWHKMSMIKNNDALYFMVDDVLVHAERGLSGFNVDGYNVAGMMIYGREGTSMTAEFRNLKFTPLAQIVDSFEIQANSNGENALNRLADIAGFAYRFLGKRLEIIPDPYALGVSRPYYNTGLSHPTWDIGFKQTQDIYSEIRKVSERRDSSVEGSFQSPNAFNALGGRMRSFVEREDSLSSYPDLVSSAGSKLYREGQDYKAITFQHRADLRLEKYDYLSFDDPLTGNLTVVSRVEYFNRIYDFQSGQNLQTINISQSIRYGQ